jgi:hypothetical protein
MLKKLLFVLLLCPLNTFAWGPTGHRIVGEIASRHLTPQARKAVSAILGKQSMAMVANWPDFIKSDTTHKYDNTSSWHYLDFPPNSDRQQFESVAQKATGQNLYVETQAMIKTLKDPAAKQADKQFALTFLIHLIGDMHQPLHVGHADDEGGNKIKLSWFDRPTNLHRVWDEHLIEYQQLSYTEYTQALDTASVNEVNQYQHGTIKDWMFESNQIADRIYKVTKADDKLSYRYNYWFVKDLNQQLLKGGLRLAAILNGIYK